MKNCILLFFLGLSSTFFSQDLKNYKVEYELKYKVDSLSQNYSHENFVLIFSQDISFFGSGKNIQNTAEHKPSDNIIDMNQIKKNKTLFLDNIYYNSVNGLNSYVTWLGNNYHYNQEIPKWKILNEQKHINGIICKKAETYFIGRYWYAWYSDLYPVNYGPYKFVGLPGLILEVFDREKTYIFSGISVKEAENASKSIPLTRGFSKQVNKKDYFSVLNELWYDSSTLSRYSSIFDKFPAEKIQQYRKSLEEKKKRRNNFPIDRDIKN